MELLKQELESLYNPSIKLTIDEYNELLERCVYFREMGAVVFVYDSILKNNIKPTQDTFETIEKLHSKTIPESSKIHIRGCNPNALKPRRRIHKIIKGHNYTDSYTKAMVHLESVKTYLNAHPEVKSISNRHKLAKTISDNCNISVRDVRYIVTKLKRTRYLTNDITNNGTNNIASYFK